MSRKAYLTELSNLSLKDLHKKIHEEKDNLFHLRMKNRAGSLKKNSDIRTLRRNIARAKTVLHSKLHNNESTN